MAKAKKTEEALEAKTEEAVVEVVFTEADVHSQDGQHVRTYSKHLHGHRFRELAHEFADRQGFEVRVH